MQKLIDNISAQVESFIEQRRNLTLLLACTDNEAGMVLKIIEDIGKVSPSDAYFFFADDFTRLQQYTDDVIEKLFLQHELAEQEAQKEGLTPLAPPPDALRDLQQPALQRLGLAMMYTRSLVPEIGEHNVIWVLCPQNIQNRTEYHQMVAAFTLDAGIQDSMQGLRIIFRDLSDSLKYSSRLGQLSGIQFYQVDMGPDAINAALDDTIYDESAPDEQRFSAMLQRAMIDSAHGRFEQAYQSLGYILGHYQKTKNHAVQAVIINAAGDIHRRKNELEQAIAVYETAVPPAVESKSATVLHNVVVNLADTEFQRTNFTLAEQYYAQADELAGMMLYADGKIRALNQQAECAVQQNAWDRAIAAWEKAADFCRNGEYEEDLQVELDKLVQAGQYLPDDKQRDYQRELHQLRQAEG